MKSGVRLRDDEARKRSGSYSVVGMLSRKHMDAVQFTFPADQAQDRPQTTKQLGQWIPPGLYNLGGEQDDAGV